MNSIGNIQLVTNRAHVYTYIHTQYFKITGAFHQLNHTKQPIMEDGQWG